MLKEMNESKEEMTESIDSEMEFDDSDGNISSDSMDADVSDNEPVEQNSAWADAMAKILKAPTKSSNFILSKAKKDSEVKETQTKGGIEFVDDSGKIIPSVSKPAEEKKKSRKEERKEMLEKQKLKAEWEAMARVKPDIKDKIKERDLVKIATRGVVHLFNSVQTHQKDIKKDKKPKKLRSVKGSFMDIINSNLKKDQLQSDAVFKKQKEEETWSILREDFMKDC